MTALKLKEGGHYTRRDGRKEKVIFLNRNGAEIQNPLKDRN